MDIICPCKLHKKVLKYIYVYRKFNIHASTSINALKASRHGLLDCVLLHVCQFVRCVLLWRSCEAAGIDQGLSGPFLFRFVTKWMESVTLRGKVENDPRVF